MWPGLKSLRRHHMWVAFVVGSLPCSERFFSGFSGFPLSSKPTFPNSNSTRNQVDEEPLCGCATSKTLFIYLFRHRTLQSAGLHADFNFIFSKSALVFVLIFNQMLHCAWFFQLLQTTEEEDAPSKRLVVSCLFNTHFDRLYKRRRSSTPCKEDEQYGNTGILCIENSYKMIPDATFHSEWARRLAEDVLLCNFYGVKYKA